MECPTAPVLVAEDVRGMMEGLGVSEFVAGGLIALGGRRLLHRLPQR